MKSKKELLLLVLLLSVLMERAVGITFPVAANREECILEHVTSGVSVGVMFQVIHGGFLDIDIRIKDPEGKVVYSADRQTEGKYSFVAHTAGQYSFCFSNKMSTLTGKTVSFVANIGSPEPKSVDYASPDDLSPLEASVKQVSQGIQAILDEQAYMKMREQVHRNTNENTNSRVIWWSLFEVLVVIAMSAWQIYYLRRFFEVKRVV